MEGLESVVLFFLEVTRDQPINYEPLFDVLCALRHHQRFGENQLIGSLLLRCLAHMTDQARRAEAEELGHPAVFQWYMQQEGELSDATITAMGESIFRLSPTVLLGLLTECNKRPEIRKHADFWMHQLLSETSREDMPVYLHCFALLAEWEPNWFSDPCDQEVALADDLMNSSSDGILPDAQVAPLIDCLATASSLPDGNTRLLNADFSLVGQAIHHGLSQTLEALLRSGATLGKNNIFTNTPGNEINYICTQEALGHMQKDRAMALVKVLVRYATVEYLNSPMNSAGTLVLQTFWINLGHWNLDIIDFLIMHGAMLPPAWFKTNRSRLKHFCKMHFRYLHARLDRELLDLMHGKDTPALRAKCNFEVNKEPLGNDCANVPYHQILDALAIFGSNYESTGPFAYEHESIRNKAKLLSAAAQNSACGRALAEEMAKGDVQKYPKKQKKN